MSESKTVNKNDLGFPQSKRKLVTISEDTLTRGYPLQKGRTLPYTIEPIIAGMRLLPWVVKNRGYLDAKLRKHGAILFRNFRFITIDEFEILAKALSNQLLEYIYRSTPRTRVSGKIYTSTEYPPNESIPLHNELSYTRNWPDRLFFLCHQASSVGGETPIADSRQVYQRIDSNIRDRFNRKGVMYIRNYTEQIDLPWQEVFQTNDPFRVEEFCRSAGICVEWTPTGQLRTKQVCKAAISHVITGEDVWFNQAHLFHESNLSQEVLDGLLSMFKLEDLPRNAYYGDGSKIKLSVLEEIRDAYRQEEVLFQWQKGDMLMLDNVLTAHGRRPFLGPRKIVVAMAADTGQALNKGVE